MPGLREALLLVAAASLLAEPLHELPRVLVLCFSGVMISAAAAVHGDVVCCRLSAPCMVARQRCLEVRGPALGPRVDGLGAGFVVGSAVVHASAGGFLITHAAMVTIILHLVDELFGRMGMGQLLHFAVEAHLPQPRAACASGGGDAALK